MKFKDADVKAIDELHTQPGLHRSVIPYHVNGSVFGWTHEQLGWPFDAEGIAIKS